MGAALLCGLAWWGAQGAGRPRPRAGPERPGDVGQELQLLRNTYGAERAAKLALRLVEESGEGGLERGRLALQVARLQAARGDYAGAQRCLHALRAWAVGTGLGGEAALLLAHVERRERGVVQAQGSYRSARDDPHAYADDRDEAYAWWIRGLCALGRHGQARDEWKALARNASTERWRAHARAWLQRCSREHGA